MAKMHDLFGSNVFNDAVMQERLPKETYKALKKTIDDGRRLDPDLAAVVAHAMKEWAVEKGVTHYTHWFQPMTGITAEKHDSFISPKDGGQMILTFSGKELVRGESDASSFPSGGLRSTFEARGYTAWDPTSYAFIKNNVLCIPTAFCSYGGEALDTKTPLLRSMEALSKQAVRVLKLFGRDATRVVPTVGPEQEYFLVDQKLYDQRMDLIFTGRTLFGAKPPKGQEMDDHYFGSVKPRIKAFMTELDEELWKLGVLAKTEHNEAAPAQHEMAPIFSVASIACDHNQLTMEMMKKVAKKHGLVCLLHEKPFQGVNGSGKHNNWSMTTNTGYNLLEPGDSPFESAQFMLFLVSVIKAVDDYQDLLRVSVASAGNDHRLGANEAPPAIVSMFLGDELNEILDAFESGAPYHSREHSDLTIGVHVLPKFPKDNTDRNRTSPFAFTGNKFEFRMVGSSDSIACANIMLNSAVAESLRQFADRLEGAADFDAELHTLLRETIIAHKRIIFNGNGYDDAWIKEATEERGLLNLKTTPDALGVLLEKKNVDMLTAHKVFSEVELRSRYEIQLDNYCKTVRIEALTMVDMARKEILPAVEAYLTSVASAAAAKKAVDPALSSAYEQKVISRLSALVEQIDARTDALELAMVKLSALSDITSEAAGIRDDILPKMRELREVCDEAETLTAESYWPFPNYGDLLFGVR